MGRDKAKNKSKPNTPRTRQRARTEHEAGEQEKGDDGQQGGAGPTNQPGSVNPPPVVADGNLSDSNSTDGVEEVETGDLNGKEKAASTRSVDSLLDEEELDFEEDEEDPGRNANGNESNPDDSEGLSEDWE